MYDSLKKTSGDDFILFILALDQFTYKILNSMSLNRVILLNEYDLLKHEKRLEKAKNNRSKMEYYYCFTANLLKYIFEKYPDIESISYVDADMFFFLSNEELFHKYKNYDILLVPHNILDTSHGKYNVCFNFFRNNQNGLNAIKWWADKTIESTRLGDGIWGDQKYLDEFPALFKNVGVITDKGFSAAPWNIMNYHLSLKDDKIFIDNDLLVCFHYARLLIINEYLFLPIKRTYLSRRILKNIYLPYMISLRESIKKIKMIDKKYRVGFTRKNYKALLGSILLGRVFYQSDNRLIRIGVNLPIAYK